MTTDRLQPLRAAPLSAQITLALLLGALCPHAIADVEIVAVVGNGDKRDTALANWSPAKPKQSVKAGGFVRTQSMSQMAILMPDRTQIRLNQNSQMQIKSVADAEEWKQSAVKLNAGRAWSQARPASGSSGNAGSGAKIAMETPAATLSIRGTAWEVEVFPDGRTQLVVLNGEVDIANELGQLKIGPGQAASAEIGKAPTKMILTNPADRIQWVTAWRVQPKRWVKNPPTELRQAISALDVGDYASGAEQLRSASPSVYRAILLADLSVMKGDLPTAMALLGPLADRGHGNPIASALLARAHLASAKADEADRTLETALNNHPEDIELWLALAEVAIYKNEPKKARSALAHSLAIDPGNADAWFLTGRIETERENIRQAKIALAEATRARSEFHQALAERGTLDTLSGDYASATTQLDKALALAPDDYVALTGRGILKLKTGEPRSALDDFLRAGMIEPRFARAWLYSAAAFYQLGEPRRAREALAKAAENDPRDPVPHVLGTMVAADELDLGSALDASFEAQTRMPYLKSLNQVQNNQKGSANIGSALSNFGLEDWAHHYATSAYSPWWAGSALFQSDRYLPGYNKNSELFKGFITDPTTFGASQRHAELIQSPGRHGRLDVFAERGEWKQGALVGTANGLTSSPFPIAYFVSGDVSTGESRLSEDSADGTNLTVGLGVRPHHMLSAFLFGTDTNVRGTLKNSELPEDPITIDDTRIDLGINLRIDAQNQIWIKGGGGDQTALVKGQIAIPALVPLDEFRSDTTVRDQQFRHAFSLFDGHPVSWGYENARQKKQARVAVEITPGNNLDISEQTDLKTRDAYIQGRFPVISGLNAEIGVFDQRTAYSRDSGVLLNGTLLAIPSNLHQNIKERNWRGGLQWQPAPKTTVTFASQNWRRPASQGSLAPTDTLGIALNDQLTANGGLYRRNRIQAELETGRTTYLKVYADQEDFNNLDSPLTSVVPDIELKQLENLRNRRDYFTVEPELEAHPEFLEGRSETYGFSINHRYTRNGTLSLRYWHADARQTGSRNGLQIPFLPEDFVRVSAQWSLPSRLLVGLKATWRSERFTGEANTQEQRLDAGWNFGISAYWESADKRWVLQGILNNLRTDHGSAPEEKSKLMLRTSYLF